MSYRKKLLQFWDKNAVVLVTVPLLIAVHWTWMKLQDVPYLVKPEDKRDLPIIIVHFSRKLLVESILCVLCRELSTSKNRSLKNSIL